MGELAKTTVADPKKLHIAMYPLIAVGHLTPYLLLADELAERGHSISFLLPNKARLLLAHYNRHPDLFKFHTITIPHVDGLPPGAETTADIEYSANNALTIAFDATIDQVEAHLLRLKPDIVFYDFAHWIPDLARTLGFKAFFYSIVSASCMAFSVVPGRKIPGDRPMTEAELLHPPEGYPSTAVVLRPHEAGMLSFMNTNYGAIPFVDRIAAAMSRCDAVGLRTCREMEGAMCDYLSEQYKKPVFPSGPVMPEAPKEPLEERWETFLSKFEAKSVVYCAFGSQTYLDKEQFQEMMLGFEMMGRPFFVAVTAPRGAETIEEALPEGFMERVGERGVVHGGWVQQSRILNHPSVGCFVSHGGFSSIWEWMSTESQIVFLPWVGDQIFNSRLLAEELRMGVEVRRRGANKWFSKEDLCAAVRSVMDEGSEMGEEMRENHNKWKAVCSHATFQGDYIDNFIHQLYHLLNPKL